MNRYYDPKILDFATDRQREIYQLLVDGASQKVAGETIGISRETVKSAVEQLEKKAAKTGYGPGVDRPTLPGFSTVRVSTLAKTDEGVQWHIQTRDRENLEALQEGLIAAFSTVQGVYKKPPKPKTTDSDLMSCYLIGDHHLGMYAWSDETGSDDYDINVSSQLLTDAAAELVASSPQSEVGALINIGDFLHANDSKNATPGAGNNLDVDGRLGLAARRAGDLLKNLTLAMLEKHKKVIVINARGNHDPDASLWLNEIMRAYFSDESRVEVLDNFSKFIWFEHGKCLVVTHHGDGIKAQQIHAALTHNLREEWGRAKHTFCWMGHIHHKRTEEIAGMQFENWNILAPPDGWAAGKGYVSERSMYCVVLHKEKGDILKLKVKV